MLETVIFIGSSFCVWPNEIASFFRISSSWEETFNYPLWSLTYQSHGFIKAYLGCNLRRVFVFCSPLCRTAQRCLSNRTLQLCTQDLRQDVIWMSDQSQSDLWRQSTDNPAYNRSCHGNLLISLDHLHYRSCRTGLPHRHTWCLPSSSWLCDLRRFSCACEGLGERIRKTVDWTLSTQ